jgi:hypothetical protein
VWNHEWLELQSFLALDLPGDPGLMANSEIAYYDAPGTDEPYYYQVYTMLGNVTGFTGDAVVTELTFHVLQDPQFPDDWYSLFYFAYVDAATDCGERIDDISKEPAMVKLHSVPMVVTKELDKNCTWMIDDEITVDINIYNATKLKSFEFLLNMPPWLYVDLQEDPIVIGDFLPGPYEELIIVVGPSANFDWVCEDQIWIKVIRECTKPPVSGDGTLATITFKVANPFLPELVGPEYTYDEDLHLWIPDKVIDEICFKGVQGTIFNEDKMWLDGIMGNQTDVEQGDAVCWDQFQEQWAVLLGPPFGPDMEHIPYWIEVDVDKASIAFAPIPGDANLDGHVGLLDLLWGLPFGGITKVGTKYYTAYGTMFQERVYPEDLGPAIGVDAATWKLMFKAADINGDNAVDILDLVQMAKNWCRSEPIHCC